MLRSHGILGLALAMAVCSAAPAAVIDVTVSGTVAYNFISLPPLGGFGAGAPVSLTFQVDSSNYVDSANFPTRGYPIDTASFVLSSGAASIGLQNPFPAGQTAYFVLRNNDPAVDGFIVSTGYEFPESVPLNQAHTTGARYYMNYYTTYAGNTLSSLDILGAVGTYEYAGLSVFNWTIWRNFPDNVGMEFNFARMVITPEPASLTLLTLLAAAASRRR